jgi:uncharacterized membrane protein YcgQ (UPF0703/DUF1980 family)
MKNGVTSNAETYKMIKLYTTILKPFFLFYFLVNVHCVVDSKPSGVLCDFYPIDIGNEWVNFFEDSICSIGLDCVKIGERLVTDIVDSILFKGSDTLAYVTRITKGYSGSHQTGPVRLTDTTFIDDTSIIELELSYNQINGKNIRCFNFSDDAVEFIGEPVIDLAEASNTGASFESVEYIKTINVGGEPSTMIRYISGFHLDK